MKFKSLTVFVQHVRHVGDWQFWHLAVNIFLQLGLEHFRGKFAVESSKKRVAEMCNKRSVALNGIDQRHTRYDHKTELQMISVLEKSQNLGFCAQW